MFDRAQREGRIEVRLTENASELVEAKRLRYHVFYQANNIIGPYSVERSKLDFDKYDDYCDHLVAIWIDKISGDQKIIGNYRLLRGDVALRYQGFISASEYDVSRLEHYNGRVVELGRACVDPEFRTHGVIQQLWAGIAKYLTAYNIDLMFGTASFPGTNLADYVNALTYLHHFHRSTAKWVPKARSDKAVRMDLLPLDLLDRKAAQREMPPLIKGYLRLGGFVGSGAVVDTALKSIDTCMLVEAARIKARYQKKFDVPVKAPSLQRAEEYGNFV